MPDVPTRTNDTPAGRRLEMLVDDIIVTGRARKNLGDLTGLMESIAAIGLLHPVGVSSSGKLLAGGRRLEAVRQLGHTSIAVTVIDDAEANANRIEHDENAWRLQLTPVEAAALRRRMKTEAGEARDTLADTGAEYHDVDTRQMTRFSDRTLDRVEKISELAAGDDSEISEAAEDALARIEAGAPIRPLHDQLMAAQAALHHPEATEPVTVPAEADESVVVPIEAGTPVEPNVPSDDPVEPVQAPVLVPAPAREPVFDVPPRPQDEPQILSRAGLPPNEDLPYSAPPEVVSLDRAIAGLRDTWPAAAAVLDENAARFAPDECSRWLGIAGELHNIAASIIRSLPDSKG